MFKKLKDLYGLRDKALNILTSVKEREEIY
jgi:hypothetical protein